MKHVTYNEKKENKREKKQQQKKKKKKAIKIKQITIFITSLLKSGFQFSSVQYSSRWYLCARKCPHAIHPPLRSFANVAFEAVPVFV